MQPQGMHSTLAKPEASGPVTPADPLRRLLASGQQPADSVPWRAICDQATGPVALLDLQGRFVYVNQALCRLLGYRREELLLRGSREITHPDDLAPDSEVIRDVLAGQRKGPTEKRYLRADGGVAWTLGSLSVIRDARGRPSFILAQMQDITARRGSEMLWHRTFNNAPIGMALTNVDGQWTAVNDALGKLLGYSRRELLSMSPGDLTYTDDGPEDEAPDDLLAGRLDTVSVEKRYRHGDGHPIWLLIRVSAVPGADGLPDHLVSQYEAIGDCRMADAHLAHLALHDPLTGLANRALLADRLDHELAELRRDGGVLAVLVADLDELKQVNDRYGHAVGDQLLIAAATELLNAVRTGDTVARLGGDEFVVVSRVADLPAAEALRDRVSTGLQTKVVATEGVVSLHASVGIAVAEQATTSAKALLHKADRDMYARKWQGRASSPDGGCDL